MLIPVIYCDHSHDMIEPYLLSRMLRERKVRSFKRSSGWVRIGIDRIRRFDYCEEEKILVDFRHEDSLLHLQEACY